MLPRSQEYNDAIRSMTAAEFEAFAKFEPYAEILVKAGEGLIMPGNTIHRVYTVKTSVAIGCNFLTFAQMETAISTWHFEKELVNKELLLKIPSMRELHESNIFINFQVIAMIWFYEEVTKLRLAVNRSTDRGRLRLLIELLGKFEKTSRTSAEMSKFEKTKQVIKRDWIQQRVGDVNIPPFEYSFIRLYLTSHLLDM